MYGIRRTQERLPVVGSDGTRVRMVRHRERQRFEADPTYAEAVGEDPSRNADPQRTSRIGEPRPNRTAAGALDESDLSDLGPEGGGLRDAPSQIGIAVGSDRLQPLRPEENDVR